MRIKLLTGFLVCVIVLSCGRGGAVSNELKVGYISYNDSDLYIKYLSDTMSKVAEGKVFLLRHDAKGDQNKQNDQVQTLMAQGVGGIIVNLVNRSGGPIIAEIAKQRRIPVVFINREPEESVINEWDQLYYVGSLDSDAGRMSVEVLADYIKNNPSLDLNGDGIVQYVVLMGEPGHQGTVLRTRAYADVFLESKSDGGMGGEELMRDSAMWQRDLAKEKMTQMMQAFSGRIEAVISNNDEMALGAIDALKEQGYFTEDGPFMPVVGSDGIPEAIDAIEEGTLLATMLNNPIDQDADALAIILALARGLDPEADLSVPFSNAGRTSANGRYVWVPYIKITRENYRGFIKR